MEQGTSPKLCECGCGKPAPIAKETSRRNGYVKGQPVRFIRGHSGSRQGRESQLSVEIGQRFGLGVVLDPQVRIPRPSNSRGLRGARLICDCGEEYVSALGWLLRGRTRSCGCLKHMTRSERLSRGEKANGRPVADKTGLRFGRLVVLGLAAMKNNRARWLCRCDCGNETVVNTGNFGSTVSCGCVQAAPRADRAPGATARLRVLQQYQRGARNRGLAWELTDEDFDSLTSSNCHYCGHPPSTVYRAGKYEGGTFTYNGLDRRDSSAGYVRENVLPCCPFCNRAKSDMSYEDFLIWIGRLVMRQWDNPEQLPPHLLEGGV